MRNIKNTKGHADIIAIVLLSLIVIMSITLIYPEVRKMIESSVRSPESCEDRIEEQSISLAPPCYNQLTNNLELNITKTGGESLKSLVFKIDLNNETKYWECSSGCGNCKILNQGNKTYHLFPERIPKTVTIVGDGCDLTTQEVIPC